MSTKATRRGYAASAALLLVVAMLTGCDLPVAGGNDPALAGPATTGPALGGRPAAGQA
ncbi:MFS transporter, partial [Micromonospora orduensis]